MSGLIILPVLEHPPSSLQLSRSTIAFQSLAFLNQLSVTSGRCSGRQTCIWSRHGECCAAIFARRRELSRFQAAIRRKIVHFRDCS